MANDGTIAFDSRINTDNLNRDLSEMEESISNAANTAEKETEKSFDNIKSQVAKLASVYKEAGMTASDAMKKAWAEVKNGSSSFQSAEKDVSDFADKAGIELQNIGEVASKSFESVPESVGKNFETAGTSVDKFSGKLQNALAAAGLAYGVAEIKEVGASYEKAMSKVDVHGYGRSRIGKPAGHCIQRVCGQFRRIHGKCSCQRGRGVQADGIGR